MIPPAGVCPVTPRWPTTCVVGGPPGLLGISLYPKNSLASWVGKLDTNSMVIFPLGGICISPSFMWRACSLCPSDRASKGRTSKEVLKKWFMKGHVMPRGTPKNGKKRDWPARIYSYGARLSPEAEEVALSILPAVNRYRNSVVENNLKDRAEYYDLLDKCVEPEEGKPTIKELCIRLDDVNTELDEAISLAKKIKGDLRSGKVDKGSARAISAIKAERTAISNTLKPLKLKAKEHPHYAALSAELKARTSARSTKANVKAVERDNLWFGHRALVDRSKKQFMTGAPPKFKRYQKNGRLGFQVHDNTNMGLYLQLGEFYINELPEKGMLGVERNKMVDCRIRIGTVEGSIRPIWLDFKATLHREFPEGAIITWAWLKPKKIGTELRWFLQIVFSKPVWEQRPVGEDVVAIMPCWKGSANGIIAARCLGTDGSDFTIDIPAEKWNKELELRDIQSDMDKKFDEMKVKLERFYQDNKDLVPEWVHQDLEFLDKWKSHERLRDFVFKWRDLRFVGDSVIFCEMEEWRKWSKMWSYHIARSSSRYQNWRLDFYRCQARDLAKRYGKVVFPDINWANLARKTRKKKDGEDEVFIEEDIYTTTEVKLQRRMAAPGTLVEAFSARIPAIKVNAEGISEYCGACLQPWDDHACALEDKKLSECFHLIRRYYDKDERSIARFFRSRAITALIKLGAMEEVYV